MTPAKAAIDCGATIATHTFNGMVGLHHRAPGVLECRFDRRSRFLRDHRRISSISTPPRWTSSAAPRVWAGASDQRFDVRHRPARRRLSRGGSGAPHPQRRLRFGRRPDQRQHVPDLVRHAQPADAGRAAGEGRHGRLPKSGEAAGLSSAHRQHHAGQARRRRAAGLVAGCRRDVCGRLPPCTAGKGLLYAVEASIWAEPPSSPAWWTMPDRFSFYETLPTNASGGGRGSGCADGRLPAAACARRCRGRRHRHAGNGGRGARRRLSARPTCRWPIIR